MGEAQEMQPSDAEKYQVQGVSSLGARKGKTSGRRFGGLRLIFQTQPSMAFLIAER